MIRLHGVLLGGLTTLLFSSCVNTEKAGTSKNSMNCLPMQVQAEVPQSAKPPVVRMAKVVDNCLHAQVIYSACDRVDWKLYWDQKMMKSYPPQVSLFLVTEDSSRCGTPHVEDIYYDLSTFAEPTFGGQVWIHLKGYDHRLKWQSKKEANQTDDG
ncbi:hypothetical protein KFE98_07885 [bacterium SCSIO 12741]|nr:hypothetical protein KFE98_07885 [bacterium SCSIO 12741]